MENKTMEAQPPYDRALFDQLVERYRRGGFAEPEPVFSEAPGKDELHELPASPGDRECLALGEEAFRMGQVASVVLAGGAGTRFGGGVKALVSVWGEQTFLDLKLADADRMAKLYGRAPAVALMTSALTHEPIEQYVAHRRGTAQVLLFQQRMLPRILEDGSVMLEEGGQVSLSPAGHGDFYRALRESGVGSKLFAQGVRWIYFSNVDNLAATLDPLIIGMHRMLGQSMTIELTPRARPDGKLDAGAAPMRRGGILQLVEKVDPKQHPFISTNNITFTLSDLLTRKIELPFRAVRKMIDGRAAIQFEQVTAEATGLIDDRGRPVLPAVFVIVPRDGVASRFHPVKAPEDLDEVQAWLEARSAVHKKKSPPP